MLQLTKTRDIIWLAGLLEGEGCFMLEKGKYLSISLRMTDEDIVVRAAILMKSTVYRYKNTWVTKFSGARTVGWMMTLYPLLGKRRKEKVALIIKFWRTHLYRLPICRLMSKCHLDRVVYALNLCKSCYYKQWKEKQLLRKTG